ncbi:MAG: hypothetical protein ABIR08_11115 [Sphingomonas sp.]
MPGMGRSIADLATRRSGATVLPVVITNMVIEGDSQTSTTPDQATNRDAFYSYAYADDPANAGVMFHVSAQVSRTVGGAAYGGPPPEGADIGSPTGNTLLNHRSDDVAYGPHLLTAMLGSNDLGTFSVDNTMAKWLDYAPPVRATGAKLAVVARRPTIRRTAATRPSTRDGSIISTACAIRRRGRRSRTITSLSASIPTSATRRLSTRCSTRATSFT